MNMGLVRMEWTETAFPQLFSVRNSVFTNINQGAIVSDGNIEIIDSEFTQVCVLVL
jgi:hypothetical protein